VAEWALAQAGASRPVVTLPNAIDAKFFARPSAASRQEARRQLGLERPGRLLLQVGQLHTAKGAPELAEAFLRIRPAIAPDTVLAFAGSGAAESEMQAIAARSGGSLKLLGQLSPEGVRTALWAADAFVLNTRRDANPLSVIEAAAAGLPIVLSAAAGNVREIVEVPQTGFVIKDAGDPSEALRTVLNAADAQLRRNGCARGRTRPCTQYRRSRPSPAP
jgi:glycosyltransferase involved in cell wall biosynthesis